MPSKKFSIFCAIMFCLGAIGFIYMILAERSFFRNEFRKTFQSSFHDTINSINCDKSIVTLKLRKTKAAYYFVQTTDSRMSEDIMVFADWDDEVSKSAFSDEIIVKHKNTIHKFKIDAP